MIAGAEVLGGEDLREDEEGQEVMIDNRSMPGSTVIPELAYPDVREAVEWLKAAFGFEERLQIADHRAQMVFGSGHQVGHMVVIQGPGPDGAEGATHAVMVRVADVDRHYAQAKQGGARIVREPQTYPYGERQYSAADFAGHLWTFSQSVADVDPSAWGGVLKRAACTEPG